MPMMLIVNVFVWYCYTLMRMSLALTLLVVENIWSIMLFGFVGHVGCLRP